MYVSAYVNVLESSLPHFRLRPFQRHDVGGSLREGRGKDPHCILLV